MNLIKRKTVLRSLRNRFLRLAFRQNSLTVTVKIKYLTIDYLNAKVNFGNQQITPDYSTLPKLRQVLSRN